VLYVALTRAKEKLILTGIIKDEEKTVGAYTGNTIENKPVSYRQRAGAVCYLDWILPAMLSYPEKYTIQTVDPKQMVWRTAAESAGKQIAHKELLAEVEHADDALVQQYDALFSYQYPYQSEAGRKSKYSVSELKHDSMVLQYDHREGEAELPEFLLGDRESYIPDFARESVEGNRGGSPFGRKSGRGKSRSKKRNCSSPGDGVSGFHIAGTDRYRGLRSGASICQGGAGPDACRGGTERRMV